MATATTHGHIGVVTGAALYVGALIGPGLLLVPALGVEAAGPASILAWVGLLILSAPLAVTFALPTIRGAHWVPFAPHGWLAIGTAANILIWLFVGWEAVAQLAGEFKRPSVDLPRAMGLAFAIVTVLYIGLAVATIGIPGARGSRVPLADLVSVGFGRVGRDTTAVLAVALTMGTMNVYMG